MGDKQKLFILGLGCQKCGTTWLHEYLMRSSNFDGGFTKEYHIWDYLDLPEQRAALDEGATVKEFIKNWPRSYYQRRMRRDTSRYFDYFDSLLRGGVSVTADITPAYSCLSHERMVEIKREMDSRGVRTKAVILFRDPVERAKSSVKMSFGTGRNHVGFDSMTESFASALADYYTSEHCQVRTAYKQILERAQLVFGEDVCGLVYEDLFNAKTIGRLSEFCAVAHDPEFASEVVHKGKVVAGSVSEELERDIARFYANQYEYFYENYPETRHLWRDVS